MILKHQLGGPVDCCSDRRELDEHVRAGAALFDHPLYRLNMPGGASELVGDGFGVLVWVSSALVGSHGFIPLGGIAYHISHLSRRQDDHDYAHDQEREPGPSCPV